MDSETATAPIGRLVSVSLDCSDPAALADFYCGVLGLGRIYERLDRSMITVSDGTTTMTMMRVDDYVPPTWPASDRPKQVHLDIAVTDLPRAVTRAEELGARVADHQLRPDLFRVLLDPAGHPFCLTTVTL
jgi:catechol 2,3-dioxygenase-like lactoylglutathione lyase family enzyme